jgi:pimeloyl-ACP methyl ester carboxylesterase
MATADFAWSAALPFFADSFDVIAPEQMGHGKTSDDPKRPLLVHTMAEDTVELMSQLGVTSAFFVGWSDGGNLALDIAMHHPGLAKKIVTTGANFSPAGADPKALAMLKAFKASDFPAEMRDWYAKNSPDGPGHLAILLDRARTMWLTDPNWTAKDLATIKAPALIIAGDHDSILTTHTVKMAEAIPGAELAIFPQAGHDVVLSHASQWNAVVLAFLNETPAKPGG